MFAEAGVSRAARKAKVGRKEKEAMATDNSRLHEDVLIFAASTVVAPAIVGENARKQKYLEIKVHA